jgi:hypothetical protein
MRYVPLAFVVLLILFLDPRTSPFRSPPFEFSPNAIPPSTLHPLVWAGLHQAAIGFFCPVNVFMDLALAFWLMVRFRPSHLTIAVSVVVIGLISPLVLVSAYDFIDAEVFRRLRMNDGWLALWLNGPDHPRPFYSYAIRDMQGFFHYGITGLASLFLGLLALANLDAMWRRIQDSPDLDPILIRPGS